MVCLWALELAEYFPDQSSDLLMLSEWVALSRIHAFVHTIVGVEHALVLGD